MEHVAAVESRTGSSDPGGGVMSPEVFYRLYGVWSGLRAPLWRLLDRSNESRFSRNMRVMSVEFQLHESLSRTWTFPEEV